jgi:lipid-A-disaccharide synthase
MNKEVVKELIQQDLNKENLIHELQLLLNDTNRKEQIKEDYIQLKSLLSKGGLASKNAADFILEFMQTSAKAT